MVDKVKPLKYENSIDGTEDDVNPTETDPTEDYLATKGIAFENSNDRRVDLDASGDIKFTDVSNPTGKTLKSIQQDIANKYNASNPNGYETPAQLSSRDTANRSRSNHTGTQLAATISNFTTAVLGALLAGLSTATGTAIADGDSILIALGKLQAQITAITTNIASTVRNTVLSGFSSSNTVITNSDTVEVAFGKAQGQISANKTQIDTNTANITTKADKVTSISAGTGLTGGGDLSANRTISMPSVGTAGTYGAADKFNSITTDAQGRVTGIVPTMISIVSSQVSNFAATVRSTVLTGLSLATSTDVAAGDSILTAFGKIQAILNAIRVAVTPSSTGNTNSAGTSTALAKADHVHDTVLARFRVASQQPFLFTSTTPIPVTGMVLTPTVAGTYWCDYTCTMVPGSNNAVISSYIFKNGVSQPDSQADNAGRAGASDILVGGAEIYMNGTTDSIEFRIQSSLNACTVNARRLRMFRVGP